MRILNSKWIGVGLLALQLGSSAAWAAPSSATATTAAQRKVAATAQKQLVKRFYDAKNKNPLPASFPIAYQRYVSASEYKDLSGGVMALLKKYPPDKFFFVGLGRDPAPVIAFLQNLGEKEMAVNLPGTSNIQWANGSLQPADIARHIEAAIPEHILKGDRQIVILDVTSSGKTPAVFGPFIDQYLANRGINKPVVKLAFSWQPVMTGGYGHALTDHIDTREWPDFANYFTGKYEGNWAPTTGGFGIAEHQRHSMTPGATPPTITSPNYQAFRNALASRMTQDPVLDEFLVQVMAAAYVRGRMEGPKLLAEWAQAQRSAKAKTLLTARAYPKRMNADLAQVVSKLAQRDDGHDKGPYLSRQAEELNTWLQKATAEYADASKLVPAFSKAPNTVTLAFMGQVQKALDARQIRNRDYRRLMGHALSASTMDAAMVTHLASLYTTSKDFHREVDEKSEYFLTHWKTKQRAGTENMEQNFRIMMATIDPNRAL